VRTLVSGRCPDCLLETKEVIRVAKMQLNVCPDCLRFKHGTTWKEGGADISQAATQAAREYLPEKIRLVHHEGEAWKPEIVDLRVSNAVVSKGRATLDVVVTLEGTRPDGKKREVHLSPTAALNQDMCRTCQLRRGGYVACVLQLRAQGRNLEDDELTYVTEQILEMSDLSDSPMAYVADIRDMKEGRDFHLGSTSAGREMAKQIVSQRGGTIRESRKLTGVEKGSGKKLYRFTLLLRLPLLRPGDVTEHMGQLYSVLQTNGFKTTVVGLDGTSLSLKEGRAADLPLVSRRESVGKALVLEVRPDGIQILDPRSNATFDRDEKPEGVRVGGTIGVIWRDDVPEPVPLKGERTVAEP
jgi:NMD protein affecting ribosome stability and mRNA decay